MGGGIARKGVKKDRNLAQQEGAMKPKKPPIEIQRQKELFWVELIRIIDRRPPLVTLSEVVDWEGLDRFLGGPILQIQVGDSPPYRRKPSHSYPMKRERSGSKRREFMATSAEGG